MLLPIVKSQVGSIMPRLPSFVVIVEDAGYYEGENYVKVESI